MRNGNPLPGLFCVPSSRAFSSLPDPLCLPFLRLRMQLLLLILSFSWIHNTKDPDGGRGREKENCSATFPFQAIPHHKSCIHFLLLFSSRFFVLVLCLSLPSSSPISIDGLKAFLSSLSHTNLMQCATKKFPSFVPFIPCDIVRLAELPLCFRH